ncbi:MAG: chromosomal replication initiator protein DnaA [Gammaproteobacteria bacterium]|nr:chromosomal replication initiator protein DnaA [Gammaproteobacteria bacterium]
MHSDIWENILTYLQSEYSEQDFNTWIRPLQTQFFNHELVLLAPNEFVVDWVNQHYLDYITQLARKLSDNETMIVSVRIGSSETSINKEPSLNDQAPASSQSKAKNIFEIPRYLNEEFIFDKFVRGRSNEFAFAAAAHVANQPGGSYNPLLIYGGVGLGKTHLMQGIGHEILAKNPDQRVLYIHSERFLADMIKALQRDRIDEFKEYYRSLDVLLIDDVQFFVGKERSQQEFFYTFNTLLENRKQIVLTCDRYPREIEVEKRLRSRFEWGLTVAIEPPELETRVAILMSKAEVIGVELSHDAAFFIAQCVQSNVRELEGALKRVVANAQFRGRAITVDFVKETLKDLITLQHKLVTIENIQKVVAEFYKLKVNNLTAKSKNRSVARPRQIAMALTKELTDKSYPEIGQAFGGRDHTTVLYAYRKIKELTENDLELREDYLTLLRILTT